MTTSGTAPEQLYQVVALAVDLFVGVESVIRDHYEGGIRRERTRLDCAPEPADERIHFLQLIHLRLPIAIMVGNVVEVADVEIKIADLRIVEIGNKLPFELIKEHRAGL